MAINHIKTLALKYKDVEALVTLGRMYLTGYEVSVDADKAYNCFERAAKKYDNSDAYYYLGYMLTYGIGKAVNKKKAVKYLAKSCELGNPKASYALYLAYEKGLLGLKKDSELAEQYRAMNDSCFTQYDKFLICETDIANMSVGNISDQKREEIICPKISESIDIVKQSAEDGCYEAKIAYAIKLLSGESKDFAKAKDLLEKCAEAKYAMAYYALGYMCELGLGDQQNLWDAFSYYSQAAGLGLEQATLNVGYFLLFGYGCSRNMKKGFAILKKLADSGNNYANYYLGIAYLNGYGCTANVDMAEECFNKASSAKIARAYYQLGLLNKIKKNSNFESKSKAMDNFKKAYELQDMDAAASLSGYYGKEEIERAKMLHDMSISSGSGEGFLEKAKRYLEGDIYSKNFEKADYYFKQAAMARNQEAALFLYESYKNGLNGYEKDDMQAFKWLEQSALNGNIDFYLQLAYRYLRDNDLCDRDSEKAAYWFAKCVRESKNKSDVANAKKALKNFIKIGDIWDTKNSVAIASERAERGLPSQSYKKIQHKEYYQSLDNDAAVELIKKPFHIKEVEEPQQDNESQSGQNNQQEQVDNKEEQYVEKNEQEQPEESVNLDWLYNLNQDDVNESNDTTSVQGKENEDMNEENVKQPVNDNDDEKEVLRRGGFWSEEGKMIQESFEENVTPDDINKIKSYDYDLDKDFDVMQEKNKNKTKE